jgi:Family of unknown function (DUF6263)
MIHSTYCIIRLKAFFFSTVLMFVFSCRMQPGSDRHYADGNPDKVYKLRFNPAVGSKFYYTIANNSELKMEVGDKKVGNQSKSTIGMSYVVGKDTGGRFLLNMVYDKIHLQTKKDDTETDLNTEGTSDSLELVQKLLNIVKGDTIQAVLSSRGELIAVNGYDEIKRKILASFNANDAYSKATAEKQWDQKIKEGLIKKNMEQLFAIFPDSAVHVGDKWKLSSIEKDEINMNIKSTYMLKDIHNGVVAISSQGEIASDNSTGNSMGYSFTATINGKQEGEFEMDTSTGMLLDSKIESDIEGEMTVMGRQIPITIHLTARIDGRKLQ